ncbi:MAG TPA: NAD(P)/FAD-dependent oxidoreductase, partial [Acidimicrobiia bacterium]|nr:NAD(P)/FAD-dependent oxidoreductase [Acidimicrobiia bacterium]
MTANERLGVAAGRRPSSSYDIVVVGARVAGAATAMLLARCGYRVLIVDRGDVGSDTVSTHTILRLGMLQLQRWGLGDRLAATDTPPIRKVQLGFGEKLVHIDLSEDFGVDALYAPRRTVLDPILVQAALEEGVHLWSQTRMVDLLWDDEAVTGIVVKTDGRTHEIRARYVIGADGMWSRTADRARAKAYRSFPAANATYYAYYEGIETDSLYFQFTEGVTAGMIPTNDAQTCVYVGWPADRIDEYRNDSEKAFLRQATAGHPLIGEAITQGRRVSRFRGTPGIAGFLRQPFGPGWALVGDAGYTKDNISAHGISDALRDAELCARAIDQSLLDPNTERDHMCRYRGRRDRLSLSLLEQSSRLGSYEWDTSEASELMRGISAAVKKECEAIMSLPEW